MRIIQQGTKKPLVFRGTCHKCGCVFEEDAPNLTVQQDQREGMMASVQCPQCHEKAWMYPAKAR